MSTRSTGGSTVLAVHHEPVAGCGRCCRPLVARRSVDTGYGRGCRARIAVAARAAAATYTPVQVAMAVESVELRAVVRAGDDYFAVSTTGDVVYHVDRVAGTCTCPAGQHGTRCYHLAAVELLVA